MNELKAMILKMEFPMTWMYCIVYIRINKTLIEIIK